jgi:uncharacterized protein (TIGR00369 family)
MASDAASQMLGIELAGYGPGWARTRMTVRDDMVNGHGICHGGLIFSLADTASTTSPSRGATVSSPSSAAAAIRCGDGVSRARSENQNIIIPNVPG